MLAFSFLLITAIIGAGFATGAELLAFFGTSSLPPILIALLVGAFLMATMLAFLAISGRAASNGVFKRSAFNVLYFIFYAAMIAGIATLSGQAAAVVAIILCIAIVCFGFERLMVVNYILTAAILIVLFWVGITNINSFTLVPSFSNIGETIISALLYAGLNSCMMEQMFRTARKKFTTKEIILSSVLAVCVVMFFVMLLLTAIRANYLDGALPVLVLSNNIVTKAVIFLAVLSSMYVALFNLAESRKKTKSNNLPFLIGISAVAYICSLFGFTKIVGTFYPMVGAVMILYALQITFSFLRRR